MLLTNVEKTVPRSVRLCWLKHDRDEDDRGDADDVPPHRDVVEERDEADPERVQQPVEEQHDAVDQDRHGGSVETPEHDVQEGVDEERQAEVDAGGDGDLAEKLNQPMNQLQAAGLPPDSGASFAAQ